MGLFKRLRRANRDDGFSPIAQTSPTSVIQKSGFAVIDVETTGLSPKLERVVQIGVVTTDPEGNVVDRWGTFVNPDRPIAATEIHGISDDHVKGAPKFADLVDEIRERLEGYALVAHHLQFDESFLIAEHLRLGREVPSIPSVCTLEESVHFLPELDQRRLSDCCAALGIPAGQHEALADATATAALLSYYLDVARREGVREEILFMPDSAVGISWPTQATVEPQLQMEAQRHKRIDIAMSKPKKTSQPLLDSLRNVNLSGLLWDEAPQGSLEYLDLLEGVIEDSVIDDGEQAALEELAESFGLSSKDSDRLKERLLSLLAAQAWSDGHLAKEERAELKELVLQMKLPDRTTSKLLKLAESERHESLSENLEPLPDGWSLGEPLRVGMKIAFTGCDWEQREQLEELCVSRGCRLTGSVSGKTDILVTDGSYSGNKAEAAQKNGTRIVHPDDFEIMLEHIQPVSA